MTESSSSNEPTSNMLELNKDLERMTEVIEKMSAKLTWMAFELVALRTNPELGASMLHLEEAFKRCKAAACGDGKPEMDLYTDTTDTTSP